MSAEIPTPSAVPSIEQQMDAAPAVQETNELNADQIRWINRKEAMYQTDSLLIPTLAHQQGIHFDHKIEATLEGDGQQYDHNVRGLGRASMELGAVINRQRPAYRIFDQYSLEEREIPIERNGETYFKNEYVLPSAETLEALAGSTIAGESGQMFFGLVHDIVKPYTKQPEDGYVELEARKPEDAHKTGRYGEFSPDAVAHYCSNTEEHFASTMTRDMQPIEINGEKVALQKFNGDHTALLIKPAILNGVRIPAGSVMTVEGSAEDGYKFAFGRLTAYSFSSSLDAKREFSEVFAYENKNFGKPGGKFEDKLELINEEIGRDSKPGTKDLVRSMDTYDVWEPNAALQKLLGDVTEACRSNRMARFLFTNREKAHEAALAAYVDNKHKEHQGTPDPRTRKPLLDAVVNSRIQMSRMFGAHQISEGQALIGLYDELVAMIRENQDA